MKNHKMCNLNLTHKYESAVLPLHRATVSMYCIHDDMTVHRFYIKSYPKTWVCP